MKRGGWYFLRPHGGWTLHAFKIPEGGRVDAKDRWACRDLRWPAREWPGCDHDQVMPWYAGNLGEPSTLPRIRPRPLTSPQGSNNAV